jgi:hypothetical protein
LRRDLAEVSLWPVASFAGAGVTGAAFAGVAFTGIAFLAVDDVLVVGFAAGSLAWAAGATDRMPAVDTTAA